MPTTTLRRWPAALAASFAILGAIASPAARADTSEADALHVLNRLSMGPAPGDLVRVQRIGIARYIDEQLHPETIALPGTLTAQLSALDTLALSQRELIQRFREAQRMVKDEGDAAKAERRAWLQKISSQAAEARLLQATQSPRQLEEVMVDFWFNHFNVFQGKGLDHVLIASYEREAIRPYALGRFRDLLGATAHHPAMLFYLDNWLSVADGAKAPRGQAKGRPSGLNENYARELMELHTLGVDGGYTQDDVTALARMLTGWTIGPRPDDHRTEGGEGMAGGGSAFLFAPRRHDDGDKTWLGRTVTARGQAEGDWALDVLASHPATARHIAYQLAQYFVADQPPPALVTRLAQRFLATDGDIRAVLKTLFDSPEFRDPAAHNAKFKTPYRYVISALRAGQVPLRNPRPLLGAMNQLGMPLYGCQTPDGYKNTEQAWLNPEALTRRITFATTLATGKMPLLRAPRQADNDNAAPLLMGQAGLAKDTEADRAPPLSATALLDTLGGGVSARTRAAVVQAAPALQAAMVLGSPDFMRH